MTSEDAHFCFASRAPEETLRAGEALAREVQDHGIVISLVGDLGAGKTHFVKGLAQGLGLDPNAITSPTFAIVNEYGSAAMRPLVHMDFYRLESEMELEEVGFLDLLAMDAVLAIEWGDRFPQSLPGDRLEVEIERPRKAVSASPESTEDDAPRTLHVRATGPLSGSLQKAWRKRLEEIGTTITCEMR